MKLTFYARKLGTTQTKTGLTLRQKQQTDYTGIRAMSGARARERKAGIHVLDPERMTFLDWFLLVFGLVLAVFFVCRWLDINYPTAVF
jgi:hypothetical protein